MKAHLIDTHLLVPRSRSSAKVKVKYQGHVSQKMVVSGALVFHKHIFLLLISRQKSRGLRTKTFATWSQFLPTLSEKAFSLLLMIFSILRISVLWISICQISHSVFNPCKENVHTFNRI